MRSRPVTLALVAALAVPAVARAQEPAPEAERPRDPYTQPLFTAGAITFLTSYGVSAGITATSLDRDNRGLYAPLVGPWIALAAHNPCDGDCDQSTRALLVLDGVVQAAGVAMMVTSLIADRRERVRQRGAHLAITSTTIGVVAQF